MECIYEQIKKTILLLQYFRITGHSISLDERVVTQGSTLVADVLSELPIPSSLVTTQTINAHGNNTNHHQHQQAPNQQPNNVFGAHDGLQIEIPTNVKALYFNNSSNNGNNQDLGKYILSSLYTCLYEIP